MGPKNGEKMVLLLASLGEIRCGNWFICLIDRELLRLAATQYVLLTDFLFIFERSAPQLGGTEHSGVLGVKIKCPTRFLARLGT